MRLLGCFTKRALILDPPAQSRPASITLPSHASPPSSPHSPDVTPENAAASTSPQPFMPATIPELHPEYAHSEPYCFVARTESARLIVDKMRGARGEPLSDRADLLREQGVVVVRGPSYCDPAMLAAAAADEPAPLPPEVFTAEVEEYGTADGENIPLSANVASPAPAPTAAAKKTRNVRHESVPLRVEVASTVDTAFVDSDDEPSPSPHAAADAAPPSQQVQFGAARKSAASETSRRTRSQRSLHGKPFRIKTRRSKQKVGRAPSAASQPGPPPLAKDAGAEADADADAARVLSAAEDARKEGYVASGSASAASETSSSSSSAPSAKVAVENEKARKLSQLFEKHMDNTPRELLAPIVVPRMSTVFGESPVPAGAERSLEPAKASRDPSSSTTVDASLRYADVEGDSSSGAVNLPPVASHTAVHRATPFGGKHVTPAPDIPPLAAPDLPEMSSDDFDQEFPSFAAAAGTPDGGATSSSTTHSLRSRRKSKPFLPAVPAETADAVAPPAPQLPELQDVPDATALSRRISRSLIAVGSDSGAAAIERARNGAAATAAGSATGLVPVTTPSAKAAARQRVEYGEFLDAPPAPGSTAGIVRRASAGKRKTVSFHDAAPVIIEPNLRAPSLSVPRNAVLSTGGDVEAELPERLVPSVLAKTRDSVKMTVGATRKHVVGVGASATAVAPRPILRSPDVGMRKEGAAHAEAEKKQKELEMEKERRKEAFEMEKKQKLRDMEQKMIEREMKKRAEEAEIKRKQAEVEKIRSEVSTMTKPTLVAARVAESSSRETSNISAASSDTDGSGKPRNSNRFSSKDRQGIRDATRRQSLAVAQAMSEQIRGVPRSAMLAFSQNEVIVDDNEDDFQDASSEVRLSTRRMSRASVKHINVPKIEPGQVPPPPPPPPFSPVLLRRSVRSPPPPPKYTSP